MDMDVYTHGLRCQIVPADRDDGGRLEYDIFGAPYSDNVVTSAATFVTTEEARVALETHAGEVAARIAAAPGELANITRLIEDAGYSVRPLPGYLHMAIRAARGEYEANVWFDPFSGWRARPGHARGAAPHGDGQPRRAGGRGARRARGKGDVVARQTPAWPLRAGTATRFSRSPRSAGDAGCCVARSCLGQRAQRRRARPRSQVPGSRHAAGWRGPASIHTSRQELRRRRQITDVAAVIAARILGGCGTIATGKHPPGHRVNRALVKALLAAIEEHDLMPVLDDDDRALNDDTDGDPDGVPFWMDHIPLRPCDDVYAYGWSEPSSPGEALLYLLFGRTDDEGREEQRAHALADLDDCIKALPTGDDHDVLATAYGLALRSRDGALPMDALARVLTDEGGQCAAAGALYAAVPTLAAYIAGSTGSQFLDLDEEMAWYNGMYTMPWDPGVIVALMDEWADAKDILAASADAVVALREPAAVARLAGLLLATFGDTPATR